MVRVLPVAVGVLALASALLLTADGVSARPWTSRAVRAAQRHVAVASQVIGGSVPGRALGGTPVGTLARVLLRRVPEAVGHSSQRAVGLAVILLGVSAVVATTLFGSLMSGIAVSVAVLAGAQASESARRRRRKVEALREMPAVYRTLSVALGSGQTLSQAVEYVGSHATGPAADAFGRMSLRFRCGMPAEEATELLSQELDAPGAGLLATALVVSHRTGSPLRDLLLRSARLVERQGEFQRLLSVKTAQVRLSVKIVTLLPLLMVGVLSLISPDFQRGLLTPSGIVCLALALMLDGLALLIIRRIVRGVL